MGEDADDTPPWDHEFVDPREKPEFIPPLLDQELDPPNENPGSIVCPQELDPPAENPRSPLLPPHDMSPRENPGSTEGPSKALLLSPPDMNSGAGPMKDPGGYIPPSRPPPPPSIILPTPVPPIVPKDDIPPKPPRLPNIIGVESINPAEMPCPNPPPMKGWGGPNTDPISDIILFMNIPPDPIHP